MHRVPGLIVLVIALWLAACSSHTTDVRANAAGSNEVTGSIPGGKGGALVAAARHSGASAAQAGHGGTGMTSGGSTGEAGLGAVGTVSGGANGQGGADAGPHFIGRFEQSASGAMFAWSGTAIRARFQGPTASVTLTDSGMNYFEVVLDGRHTILAAQAGKKQYALGSGLRAGAHDLLLYRRTEPLFGPSIFHGFDFGSGAYLPLGTGVTRRLEVIGDSISAGYGNEGTLPCQFESKTENHYLSYEALAARALQTELYTEAWSGIGLYRNNDGSMTETMNDRYSRTLPDNKMSSWDFSKYVPDALVINLGSNDFAKGDPGAPFQAAYLKLVTELRAHYPVAHFFLALGPMLSGTAYDQARVYLNAVIAARSSAGDTKLRLVEFGTQDGQVDGLGCDYHPSLKTHQRMADKLVAAVRAELPWPAM